jgi:TRAP-type mannitol/chloroaromatic compound transport system permease small subunit
MSWPEEIRMQGLLGISRLIDGLNNRIGHLVYWLILVAVLVSSGNATVRYLFDTSSNAWLELQWYLFSLQHSAHVRIDVIYSRWSRRTQLYIDVFGTLFFLLPMAILILYLSWPVFMNAFMNKEVSSNAGGLIVWPARMLLPVGFFLLVLQGLSELIKRIAIIQGLIADPALDAGGPTAEEELARAIQEAREKELADAKHTGVVL